MRQEEITRLRTSYNVVLKSFTEKTENLLSKLESKEKTLRVVMYVVSLILILFNVAVGIVRSLGLFSDEDNTLNIVLDLIAY